MSWDYFIYFSSVAVLLWIIAAVMAFRSNKRTLPTLFTVAGLLIFFVFIVGMWISLERPPLRTMGETRLWYSFFLPVVGLITYQRWRYKWLLSFSTLLATVFIVINIAKPEIHNKVLMPALQSPWFSPHVIIYMFSYAILGAVTLIAIYYLVKGKRLTETNKLMEMTDNLVYVGTAFITIGMLLGAIWAKEAWGHYWSWDPKETWAAATWISYIIYIHIRLNKETSYRTAMIVLIISFVMLQICWWGLNYLPSAQQSVHVYS
ncbi:MAG: cytochrome c biogenesis protein CcsA [Candidatus Saccharimonadaceae bacterium]